MDRVLQLVPSITNYKKCSTCKNILETNLPYKRCGTCRTKDKVRREKARLKMEETRSTAVLSADAIKAYEENASVTHRDESQFKVVKGVKRKAEISLYELEGDERKMAMEMMKTNLNQTLHKQPLPSLAVKPVSSAREYQNASSLYDALKSKALSSYPASDSGTSLQFHGSHTIVSVSSINNIKRMNLVVTDLRKIVRLSFELGDSMLSTGPSGSVTVSYPCTCLGNTQAVAPAGPGKSDRPGSLIRWARANFSSTTGQAEPRMCGGKVSVTALDDHTHPLGIDGQQIIVCVEHPDVFKK